MISIRHESDFVMELVSPGTQTAGIKDISILPFDAALVAIIAKLGTAGVTGSQISDIHSITATGAGTTIFGNAAKITYGAGVDGALNAADLVAPISYNAGTLFTLEVDSAHSGTAAIHQKVLLIFRRKRASKIPALLTNTVAGLANL